VDDFGVKYIGKEHAQHLKNTLEQHYKLTCDWTGTRYIGITLDWDYNKRQVHLSMPNYVKKALKQFQHIAGKLQHSPYPSVPIQYGATKQHATQESTAPLLDDRPNASFNKYAENSYSLAEQWTAPYFAGSVPLYPNHQNQPQTRCNTHFNSLII